MILEIVKYGHPVLREKGRPVTVITDEIRQLATDMLQTMYAANGVGLAAQQVGSALQLTVLDVADVKDRPSQMFMEGREQPVTDFMPLVLINPVVSDPVGEQVGPEGCLSIPDISADIRRADRITVTATNLDANRMEFACTGLLSRAIQHELDHLRGILFIDRMDPATRAGFAGQLKRMQQETLASLKKSPRRAKGASRV